MATRKTTAETPAVTSKNVLNDSVFTVAEFANMSNMFDTTPDVVTAALRVANVTETDFLTAKRIIKNFKNKEV